MRAVGFLLPAAVAVGIMAMVVLLPPYARLQAARYERDCLLARQADAEALIAAQQRLIDALPRDVVLTKRLAQRRLGLRPNDEMIIPAWSAGAREPAPIPSIQTHPLPQPPPRRLMKLASRLGAPRLRRGLMLLAGGLLILSILLSDKPDSRPQVRVPGRAG